MKSKERGDGKEKGESIKKKKKKITQDTSWPTSNVLKTI